MNRNFYHIYPLGLTGAPMHNNLAAPAESRIGQLNLWIDHLSRRGFNALYFGPVFQSLSHGYDTIDYYTVDRRLGTNSDFKKLCADLKEKGFVIYLDGVFNHVSREFPPFRDVMEKGERSMYLNWFRDVSFSPLRCKCWEGHESLVELNLSDSDVKSHLFGAIEMWYREFGIEGLRLDVAYCLDKDFLRELRQFTRSLNKDFKLLGEVIHGDYREWLLEDLFDTVTNYECYKGIYSSLNDNNYYEIAYSLKRLFGNEGIYKDYGLYNFVDNHDVNRIASILDDPRHYYNAMILLYAMPGSPSVYYGSEWQIEGERDECSDQALRPPLSIENHPADERESASQNVIDKLAEIRKICPALASGDYRELHIDSNQLVFSRETGDALTICALNSSDHEVNLKIAVSRNGTYLDRLNGGEVASIDGFIEVRLWPCWGAILDYND